MKIGIDGRAIGAEKIKQWEDERRKAAIKMMRRVFDIDLDDCTNEELAAAKRAFPDDAILRRLHGRIWVSDVGTKLLNALCHERRRSSVTEIDLPHISAKRTLDSYFDVMLNNSEENRLLGIRANPDHYLVKGCGDMRQEVIECTGAMGIQSHFIIVYGDESGLQSKHDPSYAYQACGTCFLADGTSIGGVRHQMKETSEGTHVRLEVEFPANLPRRILKQHQIHLACEFSNWFGEILRRDEGNE